MNLEDRFFYRLIKVTYNFGVALFFIIMATVLYWAIPPSTADYEQSHIVCNYGRIYPLKTFDLWLELDHTSSRLNQDGIKWANFLCRPEGNIKNQETSTSNKQTNLVPKFTREGALAELERRKQLALKNSQTKPVNFSLKILHEPRDWENYTSTVLLESCCFCNLLLHCKSH